MKPRIFFTLAIAACCCCTKLTASATLSATASPALDLKEFVTFCNEEANSDPLHFYDLKMTIDSRGASIERLGVPGSYRYQAEGGRLRAEGEDRKQAEGSEKNAASSSVTFLSYNDVLQYCAWKNKSNALSSSLQPVASSLFSSRSDEIDEDLKSNILTWQLIDSNSVCQKASGLAGALTLDEEGEAYILTLAAIFSGTLGAAEENEEISSSARELTEERESLQQERPLFLNANAEHPSPTTVTSIAAYEGHLQPGVDSEFKKDFEQIRAPFLELHQKSSPDENHDLLSAQEQLLEYLQHGIAANLKQKEQEQAQEFLHASICQDLVGEIKTVVSRKKEWINSELMSLKSGEPSSDLTKMAEIELAIGQHEQNTNLGISMMRCIEAKALPSLQGFLDNDHTLLDQKIKEHQGIGEPSDLQQKLIQTYVKILALRKQRKAAVRPGNISENEFAKKWHRAENMLFTSVAAQEKRWQYFSKHPQRPILGFTELPDDAYEKAADLYLESVRKSKEEQESLQYSHAAEGYVELAKGQEFLCSPALSALRNGGQENYLLVTYRDAIKALAARREQLNYWLSAGAPEERSWKRQTDPRFPATVRELFGLENMTPRSGNILATLKTKLENYPVNVETELLDNTQEHLFNDYGVMEKSAKAFKKALYAFTQEDLDPTMQKRLSLRWEKAGRNFAEYVVRKKDFYNSLLTQERWSELTLEHAEASKKSAELFETAAGALERREEEAAVANEKLAEFISPLSEMKLELLKHPTISEKFLSASQTRDELLEMFTQPQLGKDFKNKETVFSLTLAELHGLIESSQQKSSLAEKESERVEFLSLLRL